MPAAGAAHTQLLAQCFTQCALLLPTLSPTPQVFAPAFRRNARWSVDPKVPDVGGPDSPWDQVAAFYDFWFSFKSWREFPHPDEEDIEAAEGRDHRRWIERWVLGGGEVGAAGVGRRARSKCCLSGRRVAARRRACGEC